MSDKKPRKQNSTATANEEVESLLAKLQADSLSDVSESDPASADDLRAAFDEASARSVSAPADMDFDDAGDGGRRTREVRVGLFIRRRPKEGDSVVIPARLPRAGILAAYCGDEDGDGSDPNRWAATVVQFFPPTWDGKRKEMVHPSLRTVQAFVFECQKCGRGIASAREIRRAVEALGLSGGRKDSVVDNLVSLGDVCPKCHGHAMTGWHQFDPLGPDGTAVFGAKALESFKDSVLSASGDLDLPPVVGYVSNGAPGSLDRLPATTMVKVMDRLAEAAAKKGLQVVSYDDLNAGDEIAGFDFVCPEFLTGTADPEELGNGLRSQKGANYQVALTLHTRAALAGRKYVLPSIDDPYPSEHKPKGMGTRGRRQGGGWNSVHFSV